jgi:hypothetical protein
MPIVIPLDRARYFVQSLPQTQQGFSLIALSIITGLGLAAFLIWLAYLLVLAIVLGLQLLVATFQELSSLISDTPVFHFLFVLMLLCLIVAIVKWMLTKTYRFVCEVQHGRL